MIAFINSERVEAATLGITVQFGLYGDIHDALKRNGATVETLLHRAFAELFSIGASLSFGVLYHYFEIEFEKESLHFTLSLDAYAPGEDMEIDISLVDGCPFEVDISDLPESVRELLHLEPTDPDAGGSK
jgi:hypothetical protein